MYPELTRYSSPQGTFAVRIGTGGSELIFQAVTTSVHAIRVRQERRAMALNLSLPVLVVDDASTMIRIITTLLRQIGFWDIEEVQGGATALAKMRTKRYGLI